MAVCSVCGKKKVSGNNVSHANNRTKRIFTPNLQKIKIQTAHGTRRKPVCTRCLRSGSVKKVV